MMIIIMIITQCYNLESVIINTDEDSLLLFSSIVVVAVARFLFSQTFISSPLVQLRHFPTDRTRCVFFLGANENLIHSTVVECSAPRQTEGRKKSRSNKQTSAWLTLKQKTSVLATTTRITTSDGKNNELFRLLVRWLSQDGDAIFNELQLHH